MATRRVAKSSVDWAKFATLVPEEYTHDFRHLKVANDKFVGRVNSLPAELKAIDFAKYKTQGVSAEMVDKFANQYKALEIPYPKDMANQKGRIDKEEVKAIDASKAFTALLHHYIKENEAYVDMANKVPQLEEMTREMYLDYFPEVVISNDNCVEGEGYMRSGHPAGYIALTPPWQEAMKRWPARISDYFQWWFTFGKYRNHHKRLNSDLYPDQPELEAERIEMLRKDRIDLITDEKVAAMVFPWWPTQEDLEERGLTKEAFEASQRKLTQAEAEKEKDK